MPGSTMSTGDGGAGDPAADVPARGGPVAPAEGRAQLHRLDVALRRRRQGQGPRRQLLCHEPTGKQ